MINFCTLKGYVSVVKNVCRVCHHYGNYIESYSPIGFNDEFYRYFDYIYLK